MDKKVINESQFRKLVISEAKKIMISEGEDKASAENSEFKSKRKVTFEGIESLIDKMQGMNKSIASIIEEESVNSSGELIEGQQTETWVPKQERDLNPIEHNKKKNIMHVNEGEKDKWNRMLNYKIPSDDER
jgi:hypothetical protein